MRTIVVVDYDPEWPEIFERLRVNIWPVVQEIALSVEHVGSTSVPGLAAKPVIDMSVVVPSEADVPLAIERMATLGYGHKGNLGVEGREAFSRPDDLPYHHMYLCPEGSIGLDNLLAVRDYLREHPETVQAYGDLKKQLAKKFPHDIDSYVEGKTDLILGILKAQGFPQELLEKIEAGNRQ